MKVWCRYTSPFVLFYQRSYDDNISKAGNNRGWLNMNHPHSVAGYSCGKSH